MIVQTIKNTKGTSKSKNSLHSEYAHKLNEYKSRITKIQTAITFEKIFISKIKRNCNNADLMGILYNRLGVLRNENNYLSEEIRKIRRQIKGYQRSKAVSSKYHYRMYSMVLRQLSPMQKGIQSLHAVVEYSEKMKSDNIDDNIKKAYETWASRDKTMIVLDAGTSEDLVNTIFELIQLNVPHAVFYEEDLYGMNTVVCFLADELVWDTKKYPSYDDFIQQRNEFSTNLFPSENDYNSYVFKDVDPEPIMKLRELIFSKKLSM